MAHYAGLPEGAEIVSQPQYAGLPAGAVVIPPPAPSKEKAHLWDKIVGTVEQVAAGVNAGANTLHLSMFGRDSETFKQNAQYWRDKAEANGASSDTVLGKVAEGAGTVPAALVEFLPTPVGVAAGVALSGSRGYNTIDPETGKKEGVKGAVIEAGKNLAFRKIFKVIDAIPLAKTLPKPVKATAKPAAMGAVMGTATAIEGGGVKDIAASTILGTALPLVTHAGAKPKAEAPAEAKASIKAELQAKGVPAEVAEALAQKSTEIDTNSPRNLEVFTEQLDTAVRVAQESKVAAPEPPVEVQAPEYIPFKFTAEERVAITEEVSRIVNEDGTVNPDVESLINLTRVGESERQMAIHQALGEGVRAKVHERLGAESGQHDAIVEKVYEEIIKRNGRDTGMDFLKSADKTSLDLQRIAVESQVVREMAAKYVKEVDRLAERANKNDATEAEKLLYNYYRERAANFVGLDAEIARQQSWALNARKIEATGEKVEVNDLTVEDLLGNPALMDQLRVDAEMSGGLDAIAKMAEAHLKAADLPQKIKAVRQAKQPTMLNVMLELRGLDLLSSLTGRVRDTLHNVWRPVAEGVDYTLAATISKARGREGADAITYREVGARLLGNINGTMEAATRTFNESLKVQQLPEALRNMDSPYKMLYESIEAAEAYIDNAGFMHGKTKAVLEGVGRKYLKGSYIRETATGQIADKFLRGLGDIVGQGDTVSQAVWKTVDLAGSIGRSMVYGTIKFTDLPSEYMGYDSEVYGLATKTAVERGLTGKEARDFTASIITRAKALRDDIRLPDSVTRVDRQLVKEIHEAAMKNALDVTLKGELEGQQAKDLEAFINNSAAGKIAKLTVNQFFSTTARLIKYEAQRNVLTFWTSKGMRDSLSGANGKRAQDLATAKLIFGSMAQAAAATLVMEGILTGYTSHKKEARDAGVLEYALNINGRLYQINQADPYGGFLSSTAAMIYAAKNVRNEGTGEYLSAGFGALVNDRLSRSWLKSLLDLKNAVQDNTGKGWIKYLQNYGSTLLPMSGIISSSRDLFGNGDVKAVHSMSDRIMKVYHPDALDNDIDLYGKERKTTDRFWGVRTSKPDMTLARMEIVKHNIKMPEAPEVLTLGIPGSKFGHKLNEPQRREYMRSLADPQLPIQMEKRLQDIVDSPKYKTLAPEVQEMWLQKVVDASHQMAQAYMLKKPEVMASALNKAEAVGKLVTDHTDLTWKGNWVQFLTGRQNQERSIMNAHGMR